MSMLEREDYLRDFEFRPTSSVGAARPDMDIEQAILAPAEPMLALSCVAFFQTILAVKVVVFLFVAK